MEREGNEKSRRKRRDRQIDEGENRAREGERK
jgi:hypothetical protein